MTLPFLIDVATPLLAFWCLGLLVLRYRPGATRHRRILREPGMVVAIATWAALAACVALELILVSMPVPPFGQRFRRMRHAWAFLPTMISLVVASSWFVMVMAGQWRPRADWIDRTGRALGVAWIGLFALGWLLFF